MQATPKSFPTKTGRCYVFADRLLLAREGAAGVAGKVLVGNSLVKPLLLYGSVAVFLFYTAYQSAQHKEYGITVFFALLGSALLYIVVQNLGNSATQVIARADIQQVVYKPARLGLTRAYFEVFFLENGRLRKRLILLPGSLSDGTTAAEAVAILQSEHLLTL